MATNVIKEITREELKTLVRELVEEVIWELEQEMPDPDEGLEFKPDVAARLEKALADKHMRGIPHDQVMRELGLDE